MRKTVKSRIVSTQKQLKREAKAINEMILKTKKYKAKMPHDWHEIHLCYLANMGYQQQDTDEYKSLVRHPNYMCKHCGRVAEEKINLCNPVRL